MIRPTIWGPQASCEVCGWKETTTTTSGAGRALARHERKYKHSSVATAAPMQQQGGDPGGGVVVPRGYVQRTTPVATECPVCDGTRTVFARKGRGGFEDCPSCDGTGKMVTYETRVVRG